MTKNKKGFTIIEVVLVLAIAGLIFLMVFIAIPALQRSQRNTRRRQDMARILSALNDYQSNNNGRMPTKAAEMQTFVTRYASGDSSAVAELYTVTGYQAGYRVKKSSSDASCLDQFCDPDGNSYLITMPHTVSTSGGAGATAGTKNPYYGNASRKEEEMTHIIHYWTKAKCDDDSEDQIVMTSGSAEIAIAYYLEGGAVYCGDNQ